MESALKATVRWSIFVLAVAATTAWVVLSFTYLNRLGWDGILSLEPGALASTLAAVAGPPAALWLVLIVVAQQQELSLLRKAVLDLGIAVKRGQDQGEISSRTLIDLTTATGRAVTKDTVTIALDDLASHAAVIAERLGVLDGDALDLAWARHGAGDRWSLLRPFVDRAEQEKDFSTRLQEAIKADGLSQLAAQAFVSRMDLLRNVHADGSDQRLLLQILEDGPLAQVERLFTQSVDRQAQGSEEASPAPASETPPDAIETDETASMTDRLGPQPTLFPAGSKAG